MTLSEAEPAEDVDACVGLPEIVLPSADVEPPRVLSEASSIAIPASCPFPDRRGADAVTLDDVASASVP